MKKFSESKLKDSDNQVVLAFSGGLDTSFCVPYLIEQGYQVTSVFVDSGGVSKQEKELISKRAYELGVISHKEVNIAEKLWKQFIKPLIKGGYWYQNQYPLLCSDRYLIVETCLNICDEIGTKNFAHGCTGMGNDQVRFDIAVQSLGQYQVISPIREIQKHTLNVREFEKKFLTQKGFSIPERATCYSINENLMGVTISGEEIDQWLRPSKASYTLVNLPETKKTRTKLLSLTFEQGEVTALDEKLVDENFTGEKLMQQLNLLVGGYSIGRGIYTGDTTIGIKGRIVFEAPAIYALKVAHLAIEQAVLSKLQNRFKSVIAKRWSELVYEGLFYDPLKADLEAFIESSQKQVTGKVIIEISQGQLHAVAVESGNILKDKEAIYAQSASWSVEEAEGFIKLFGKSSIMAASHLAANTVGSKYTAGTKS
jgi:argininosuccinate synthase